jgi:hypothetical protein
MECTILHGLMEDGDEFVVNSHPCTLYIYNLSFHSLMQCFQVVEYTECRSRARSTHGEWDEHDGCGCGVVEGGEWRYAKKQGK